MSKLGRNELETSSVFRVENVVLQYADQHCRVDQKTSNSDSLSCAETMAGEKAEEKESDDPNAYWYCSPEEALIVGSCCGLVLIPVGDFDGYLAGQVFMAKLSICILAIVLLGLSIF